MKKDIDKKDVSKEQYDLDAEVLSNTDYVEDITDVDLIYEAHDKMDALIDLLIEKNVIKKDDYEEKLMSYINR